MNQTVLLFTGHLLDNVERTSARFPYRLIREVDRMIQAELDVFDEQSNPLTAISSLAAGGDMIFAREAIRRRIPLDVFLPFEEAKFLATSVKYIKFDPTEDINEWVQEFHQIVGEANSVTISKVADPAENEFTACNRAMLEYALKLTKNRPDRIMALALVAPNSEIIPGGSAEFINVMERSGLKAKKIWPVRSNRLYK